jgi:hypothetical protein
MLRVAWPFMRVSFNQPLAATTLVLTFGVAATVISTSCWTWAATRIGFGRLLAGSVAISATALLCCALAPAYLGHRGLRSLVRAFRWSRRRCAECLRRPALRRPPSQPHACRLWNRSGHFSIDRHRRDRHGEGVGAGPTSPSWPSRRCWPLYSPARCGDGGTRQPSLSLWPQHRQRTNPRDGHVGGGELRRSEACWSSPYRPALSLR